MGTRASTAIVRRVAEIALQLAPGSGDRYAATAPPGVAPTLDRLAVLSDPAAPPDPVGAADAAVELARLVDRVQAGTAVFDAVGTGGRGYVSDVYRALTPRVEFALNLIGEEARHQYERAEGVLYVDPPFDLTEPYRRYLAGEQAQVAGALELDELRRRVPSDAAERAYLGRRIETLEATQTLRGRLLVALDAQHGFEVARAIVRAGAVAGFPASCAEARKLLDTTAFDILAPSTGLSHLRADLLPPALGEDAWTPFRLDRTDIAAAPEADPLLPPVAPELALGALDEDSIDAVEAEVQVLEIDRPWMWEALFGNRAWRWLLPATDVSEGAESSGGSMPAYPVAVVVARRLRVAGRAELVAPAVLASAQPVLLGAFVLAGLTQVDGAAAPILTVGAEPGSEPPRVRALDRVVELPVGDFSVVSSVQLRPIILHDGNLPGSVPASPPGTVRLTVVARLGADPWDASPMPVPYSVVVERTDVGERQEYSVQAGAVLELELAPGRYHVSSYCSLYDVDGDSTVELDLISDSSVDLRFRPRTLVTDDRPRIVGFLCRRVPRSPNPDPAAVWPS